MPKGLEVLIPKRPKKNEPTRKEIVFWIELKKVKPNPLQPRKEFDKKELKELADSIEKYGILQPLIVKKIEKSVPSGEKVEYQLIAGERRLRASKIAGLKEVPVIVQDIKKEDELPISLVENIQRENLNPIERANAYKRLIEENDFTQKEIADVIGKSREVVANTLRILDLPEEIKKSLKKEEISEGHARALLGIKKEDRISVFKEIIKRKLPVREIEKKNKKKITKEKSNSDIKLERKIKEKTNAESVRVKEYNGKFEINLLLKNKKELNRFIKNLK
ncbi:MAG: ParB/RepB/Spo0J family partition protein [Candidatus Pacebacteria bacterium]|nr:ParB/RepB/Spo0J family partition protein [Candidatus Paceibacterota bacterium]